MNAKSLKRKMALGAGSIVVIGLATTAWLTFGNSSAQGAEITVYKTPSCGCCSDWADYLKANGFKVHVQVAQNLAAINAALGVPADLQNCHTGVVDGYAIMGHVPAEDIQRLLTEKPQATGLAVPGMPIGSPGMEQGLTHQSYNTVLFAKTGTQGIWAAH